MDISWRRPSTIAQNTRTYTDGHSALRFLLGGIGTGNISLMPSGVMTDFEVFNHPDKGIRYPFNFYSIWSQVDGEESSARVLEAYPKGIDDSACGTVTGLLPGLPRYDSSTFRCQYPFGTIEFERPDDPIKVKLSAFTPFVPLDAKNSGLPGFCARYTVTNTASRPATVSIASTMYNITGMQDYLPNRGMLKSGESYNEYRQRDGLTGVMMGVNSLDSGDVRYGTMCIATPSGDGVSVRPEWQSGGWMDGAEDFWQGFSACGELRTDDEPTAEGSAMVPNSSKHFAGSVASKKTIPAGESAEFVFYYFWHFPNRYGWWPDMHLRDEHFTEHDRVFRNYYASQWADAWVAMEYFHDKYDWLYRKSWDFADALYSSTLGVDVVESLVAGLCVLRSPTVFRLDGGEFYGWEGCGEHWGSCAGTCTHVWNYAQAAAFLFPEMERSMRRTEYIEETDDRGDMASRAKRRLDGKPWGFMPATDGQWGSIARVYREWKLSGDDEFLRLVWDKLALCVDYSIQLWDADGDGVMEGRQHNTYDIEFYGANPLTNPIMYTGLRAAAAMADYLDDPRGGKWLEIAERGAAKMDELLWNGEYYHQQIAPEDLNRHKYQLGDGCLSDQLLGQTLAHLYGLGHVLPRDHVRSALRAIYNHNFRPDMGSHSSVQRGYLYQDEGGLLLCSWPRGGRPLKPFVYSDEVWTGIEYQVATHLIYEGMIDEAMNIVKAIRARHNGYRRSPQNEVECGNHYARSMASWGLLIALSGYTFDMTIDEIGFDPKINEDDFCCFYSNGKSWGVFRQRDGEKDTIALNT